MRTYKELAELKQTLSELVNEMGTERFASFVSDAIDRSSVNQGEKNYRHTAIGSELARLGNEKNFTMGWRGMFHKKDLSVS